MLLESRGALVLASLLVVAVSSGRAHARVAEVEEEASPPAAPAADPPPTTREAPPPPNLDPELRGDEEGEDEILAGTADPRSREEVEREEERRLDEEMDRVPPPPDPEWRLRAGLGVALPLNGSSTPYLRIHQDAEWQPLAAAPLIFGIGGAEYVIGSTLGSVGARVGLATYFCGDSVVRCQAALAFVIGAFFAPSVVAFDLGGEGDVRFQFGAFELSVRLGFGGGGGYNMLLGGAGIGAAF